MKRRLAAAVLACLAVAGCGSAGHSTSTPRRAPSDPWNRGVSRPWGRYLTLSHPCTSSNYFMQCVTVPTPPTRGVTGSYGFDFAWGGPPGFTAKRGGAHFGASYLSYSSKDWTSTLLRSYRSAGVPVVFVWETSAARSLDGYSAGYSDAYNAFREAAALGYGRGTHIDFASDFDTTYYGSRFVPYYQGAAAYAKRIGDTTGAYGGLHTIATLCSAHVGSLNWQTIAWSGGQWVSPSCAPLRQTGINDHFAGYNVDNDVAVAANFGQMPAVAPKPKPSRAQIARWTRAREQSAGAYIARDCYKLAQREMWYGKRLHGSKAAKHRRALRATRRAYAQRSCGVFAHRMAYYLGKLEGK